MALYAASSSRQRADVEASAEQPALVLRTKRKGIGTVGAVENENESQVTLEASETFIFMIFPVWDVVLQLLQRGGHLVPILQFPFATSEIASGAIFDFRLSSVMLNLAANLPDAQRNRMGHIRRFQESISCLIDCQSPEGAPADPHARAMSMTVMSMTTVPLSGTGASWLFPMLPRTGALRPSRVRHELPLGEWPVVEAPVGEPSA